MKYLEARYVPTDRDEYLELHCPDGTYRGVVFENATAADDAMRSGRAELDCDAVTKGFLPRGATLVSRPGVILEVFKDDRSTLEEAEARAADVPYVTVDSDKAARQADAAGSSRYDLLAEFSSELPSPRTLH